MGVALLCLAILATGVTLGLQPPRFQGNDDSPTDDSASPPRPLSARIPPGQVATALRLGSVESVAGAIRAGDTIDVYAFLPDRATGSVAATQVHARSSSTRQAQTQTGCPSRWRCLQSRPRCFERRSRLARVRMRSCGPGRGWAQMNRARCSRMMTLQPGSPMSTRTERP